MQDDLVPSSDWIRGLIEQIYAKGVRRPGSPANRWTVEFCAERFREFGLENVRLEPVSLPYWEPRSWSLHVTGADGQIDRPQGLDQHRAVRLEVRLADAPQIGDGGIGLRRRAGLRAGLDHERSRRWSSIVAALRSWYRGAGFKLHPRYTCPSTSPHMPRHNSHHAIPQLTGI